VVPVGSFVRVIHGLLEHVRFNSPGPAGVLAGGDGHPVAPSPHPSHEPTVFEGDGTGEGEDVIEANVRCQTGALTYRISAVMLPVGSLLRDIPALWEHPGVTPEQRRDLAREVFEEIRIRDGNLVAVKPRPQYAPLFGYSLWKGNREVGGEQSP